MNFVRLRLIAGIVTAILLSINSFGPEREIRLFPNAYTQPALYADSQRSDDDKGNSIITPLNSKNTTFICNIQAGAKAKSCGTTLNWLQRPANYQVDPTQQAIRPSEFRYLNFNHVQQLRIRFSYRGEAKQLRLFLRNAQERTPLHKHKEQKFLSAIIETKEFNKPIYLLPGEFSVPHWWVKEAQSIKRARLPELNNVFQIGIDMLDDAPVGRHFFAIEEVTAFKNWLPQLFIYWSIIVLWLTLLMMELLARAYLASKHAKSLESIPALTEHISTLRRQENIDSMTELYNRKGIQEVADILFTTYPPLQLSLIALDIDYFKHINNTYGDTEGDSIIKQFAQLITQNIRGIDILGRLENVKFLLICQHPSTADAYNLAEKLRVITANHEFDIDHQPHLVTTISLGIAFVGVDEPFEYALNRSNNALYHAKDTGRNCIRMA